MALQSIILVPPDLWQNRQTPPPAVKKILQSKNHIYNKWTEVRLYQEPYLKTEKQKREPIPIPIVEPASTKPSLITKPKRKRIIRSVPLFKTEKLESESEIDSFPYIQNVLKRKTSHDPTFGLYQDETDRSFKIGRYSFKYNDKHMFVDGKMYKATQGLWELLTQSRPDKNAVTFQDRQANKQILLQSNAHRVNYSPSGKTKRTRVLNIRGLFHNSLLTKRKCLGNH